MAQTIDYYVKEADRFLDPSYGARTDELNRQIAGAETDPYYTSLLSGLEATKNREFAGIESRAAQRGVAYGNIPSQAQGAYLGEKYLPAVAEVKKTQSDYINNLKMKLADLKAQRAESATTYGFKMRESDISVEEAAKDRAAAANSKRSAGPSGTKNLSQWEVKAMAAKDIAANLGKYSWGDLADTIDAKYGAGTATSFDQQFWGYYAPGVDYKNRDKSTIDWSKGVKDKSGKVWKY